VRVAAGTSVGYVAVYNWLASAANRARLGDFEIWVGRAAGDTNVTNNAVKCGDSSYDASKPEEEPYVLWCGYASSGWSDSDGGEYITLKQTGDKRELRITELKVYDARAEPSSEASPSPEPVLSPSPPPSALPSPPPATSASPPAPPAPPLSALTEATRISAEMSSTGDAEKPATYAIDDILDKWTKTEEGINNWVSVRVAAGTSVGYVAVYNWLGSAANRARLGDFEIWVGRAAGDTDTANGAVKCGDSSYEETKPEEEPYVLWCGEASSGWSDSDGGEYITLKQVGDSRELRITELKAYDRAPGPSPPPSASPSPPPSTSPAPPVPPLGDLTEATRISAEMSSTGDAEKPATYAIDDILDKWTKTEEGINNWVSVRVAAGTSVGYVAVYNWLGSAANRARLGDFEIWVGRAAGDTDTANGAVKCGDSSYEETKPEEEPYVLWCGEASSGWSDSDGGEYITLKQTGDKRELRITELKVYVAP